MPFKSNVSIPGVWCYLGIIFWPYVFNCFNKKSVWGRPVRIQQAICHQHQLEAGVSSDTMKPKTHSPVTPRLLPQAHVPHTLSPNQTQKLPTRPARPRLPETLPQHNEALTWATLILYKTTPTICGAEKPKSGCKVWFHALWGLRSDTGQPRHGVASFPFKLKRWDEHRCEGAESKTYPSSWAPQLAPPASALAWHPAPTKTSCPSPCPQGQQDPTDCAKTPLQKARPMTTWSPSSAMCGAHWGLSPAV